MTDLKKLLDLTFKKRKSLNKLYSKNAFARDIGVSPTALSQFLTGKRNLSKGNIKRLTESLGLPADYENQLSQEVIPFPDSVAIAIETFTLIAEWFHLAILNLTEVDKITSIPQISQRLAIPTETAEAAVVRLTNLGFLTKTNSGYKRLQGSLDTGTGFPSQALRNHNREKMELAIQHLQHGNLSDRDISSLTLSFNKDQMPKLKNEINRFKKRVASNCVTENADEVFSLNIQFFPLSHPLQGSLND